LEVCRKENERRTLNIERPTSKIEAELFSYSFFPFSVERWTLAVRRSNLRSAATLCLPDDPPSRRGNNLYRKVNSPGLVCDHPSRKAKRRNRSDASPSDKAKRRNLSDASPNGKAKRRNRSDASPNGKAKRRNRSDASPSNKAKRRSLSDASPNGKVNKLYRSYA
jgi:hypothetical protein